MFGLIWNVIRGGGLLTATAAGGTAVAVGLDSTLNHGNITKRLFGDVVETLGQGQAEGGIETQWYGFLKWIDTLMEAFVGANGRSPFTDFVRGGVQRAMGKMPDEQELGSTAKPETLTNPASEGYMGPLASTAPGVDTRVDQSAGRVPNINTDGVTVPAETPAAIREVSIIQDPGAWFQTLGAEMSGIMKEDGTGIDFDYVRSGTGEIAKSTAQGLSGGVGFIGGGALDILNGLEEVTIGNLGWEVIPDPNGFYALQAAEGLSGEFAKFAENNLGGAPDIEHSPTAQLFNFAGGFLAGGPAIKGTSIAMTTAKLAQTGVQLGTTSTTEAIKTQFDPMEP